VLEGIAFVLKTGIGWTKQPVELGYGLGWTCWRRMREWFAAGVFDQMHQAVLDQLGERGELVTLRHNSRLHHIGVGRAHAGTNVLILVKDLNVRIIARDITAVGPVVSEFRTSCTPVSGHRSHPDSRGARWGCRS
jgi:Putative transposase of IS4/5 family (DUF4096)